MSNGVFDLGLDLALATGVRTAGSGAGVVLVEAKAHVAEFALERFGGTKPASVEMITAALDHTRAGLGATAPVDT